MRFGLKALRWGDHGPVVLTLHGWEGGPHQFRVIGSALAERGCQVFALTGPGHSQDSGRVAHPGLFVDALLEAAAELGPLQGLIGHSMGAGAVLLAQGEGLRAERSVCVAGPAGYRGVLERIADQLGLAPDSRARFLRRMEARTGLTLDQTHPASVLSRIQSRLMVVHDVHDRVVPYADAEEITRHGDKFSGPNPVQLLTTHGLGHGRILKDRSVVDAVCRFLQP